MDHDVDIWYLVVFALLCEAGLGSAQIPTAGVTWGGNENAKYGGIDVRVEVSSLLDNNGYIPRSNTVFQVKNRYAPKRYFERNAPTKRTKTRKMLGSILKTWFL
ncbi:hypothetical protein [Paenibacillus lentus]|uniref:Uncharacterized protein n=1 Tax=Paenibacillus lentus TaxID=1338368 RepID=A0A3Q8S5F5_9BACL|nr:hypothetical protein [Paenibacillus lentus]AZK47494.1 hypothetical protein EIM92_16165 [Paenibacillus lentus]